MGNERTMEIKVAYLLLIHHKPEQANIFIEQLIKNGDCDIYIHIDKKSPELAKRIMYHENIHIYSEYSVSWGSFEIIKAALLLMEKAEGNKNRSYTHMYFGTGQDMLVRKGFYKFLESNPTKIFIKIVGEIKKTQREAARFKVKWPSYLLIRNDYHIYRFIRIFMSILCRYGINLFANEKKLRKDVIFYEGRTWFICPVCVIGYILNYVREHEDYIEFWKDSLASDLMFFQTIIMNSSYAKAVEDELMFVEFGKTFGTMNHPLTITVDKVEEIDKSNCFFARKFDLEIDKNVIEYYKKQN